MRTAARHLRASDSSLDMHELAVFSLKFSEPGQYQVRLSSINTDSQIASSSVQILSCLLKNLRRFGYTAMQFRFGRSLAKMSRTRTEIKFLSM